LEILLVDDNPTDAELAVLAIRQTGYPGRVVHMDSGMKAIDYLARAGHPANGEGPRPRVIFLDLKLRGMDGIDVLRRLKGDETLRSIPVVMMTSSQEISDLCDCYRLGVNSYVMKPVDFEEYRALVAKLLEYWTRLNLVPVAPD
jgi:CheY-like chemotaxis protein